MTLKIAVAPMLKDIPKLSEAIAKQPVFTCFALSPNIAPVLLSRTGTKRLPEDSSKTRLLFSPVNRAQHSPSQFTLKATLAYCVVLSFTDKKQQDSHAKGIQRIATLHDAKSPGSRVGG